MKGQIVRIHNCRDKQDSPYILSQMWVVNTDQGEQFLLSVKPGQLIEFEANTTKTITQVALEGKVKKKRSKKKTKGGGL